VSRILVVDDDEVVRELIRMKLEAAGHDVISEVDGEAGLAAALQEDPDLILLDWMMPRLTGPEVCQLLRESDECSTVPVILLTAKAQEVDVERGLAAGADDYVVKPFSARELLSRVQTALARVA
jgi:DNA-binding response OmpR family regulator